MLCLTVSQHIDNGKDTSGTWCYAWQCHSILTTARTPTVHDVMLDSVTAYWQRQGHQRYMMLYLTVSQHTDNGKDTNGTWCYTWQCHSILTTARTPTVHDVTLDSVTAYWQRQGHQRYMMLYLIVSQHIDNGKDTNGTWCYIWQCRSILTTARTPTVHDVILDSVTAYWQRQGHQRYMMLCLTVSQHTDNGKDTNGTS